MIRVGSYSSIARNSWSSRVGWRVCLCGLRVIVDIIGRRLDSGRFSHSNSEKADVDVGALECTSSSAMPLVGSSLEARALQS